MSKLSLFVTCLLFLNIALQASSAEVIFTQIYENNIWGVNAEKGRSGGGSSLASTRTYRQFLESLLRMGEIRSIVDAGCGDWSFSKEIDWMGIEYIGIDIVATVISENLRQYESNHVTFIHADIVEDDLPEADLLICKEVLQHLTNEDVKKFIKKFSKFKYCLVTNDVNEGMQSCANRDIHRGGYRPLDLTQAPFYVKGLKVLTYPADACHKQTLLIVNH